MRDSKMLRNILDYDQKLFVFSFNKNIRTDTSLHHNSLVSTNKKNESIDSENLKLHFRITKAKSQYSQYFCSYLVCFRIDRLWHRLAISTMIRRVGLHESRVWLIRNLIRRFHSWVSFPLSIRLRGLRRIEIRVIVITNKAKRVDIGMVAGIANKVMYNWCSEIGFSAVAVLLGK